MTATKHTLIEITNHLCGIATRGVKHGLASKECPKGIWLVHETGVSQLPFTVRLALSGHKTSDECYSFHTMEEVKMHLPKGFRLIKVTCEELK